MSCRFCFLFFALEALAYGPTESYTPTSFTHTSPKLVSYLRFQATHASVYSQDLCSLFRVFFPAHDHSFDLHLPINTGTQATLKELQDLVAKHLPSVKAKDGFKSAQRVICGGCYDFKVILAFDHPKFEAWEKVCVIPSSRPTASIATQPS
jgi:hypothetical protein